MKKILFLLFGSIIIFIIFGLPVTADEWSLSKGQTWEFTVIKDNQLYEYSKHVVAGREKWKGRDVWKIKGENTLYDDDSNIKEQETIRLAMDYRLLYNEIVIRKTIQGKDVFIKPIIEWQDPDYCSMIDSPLGIVKKKIIPYPEPVFLFDQSTPYLLEILIKTKSILPDIEFPIYCEDTERPAKLKIVAGNEESFQMPKETITARTYLIPELNQKIYLDVNDQIIAITDDNKGMIYYRGNYKNQFKE